MRINNSSEIPAEWGDYLLLVKNQRVTIREVICGGEQFVKSWGTLEATSGADYIIQVNGKDQYPIKKEEFAAAYVETADAGFYIKTAYTKVVPIPDGVEVILASKEGDEKVAAPDGVAVDSTGGVYAFPLEKNLKGQDAPFAVFGKEPRLN